MLSHAKCFICCQHFAEEISLHGVLFRLNYFVKRVRVFIAFEDFKFTHLHLSSKLPLRGAIPESATHLEGGLRNKAHDNFIVSPNTVFSSRSHCFISRGIQFCNAPEGCSYICKFHDICQSEICHNLRLLGQVP
jgi:hypothetical protein